MEKRHRSLTSWLNEKKAEKKKGGGGQGESFLVIQYARSGICLLNNR